MYKVAAAAIHGKESAKPVDRICCWLVLVLLLLLMLRLLVVVVGPTHYRPHPRDFAMGVARPPSFTE